MIANSFETLKDNNSKSLNALRVLHSSDFHIGKLLYDRKRYDEFERFFEWFLNRINDESIDIVLIAGDIFDTGTPSNKAQELYYKLLAGLSESKCQHVVIIAGNHDSASFLNAPKNLLKALNLHIVAAISENLEDEVLILDLEKNAKAKLDEESISSLIVCAVPYLRDKDIRIVKAAESIEDKAKNLVNGIKEHYQKIGELAVQKRDELDKIKLETLTQQQESSGKPNTYIPIIGMGHLFAAGGIAGDGVRDLYVGSLAYVNAEIFPDCFDYVALGHLHIPQRLANSDYIRYSGSPLAMGFGEANQKKKLLLLEIHPNGEKNVKEIPIPVFQDLVKIAGDLAYINAEINKLIQANSSAWLEIDYTADEIIPDLKQKLEELVSGSNLEICRIRNKRNFNMILSEDHIAEKLEHLDPLEIFNRCLELNQVPDTERDLLNFTYKEILDDVLAGKAEEQAA